MSTKTFVEALTDAFGTKDRNGEPVRRSNGVLIPDPELTDDENVPLGQDIEDYSSKEVLPHVPDAYIDEDFVDDKDGQLGKVGYEVNFNRFFYRYERPRPLEEIDADLEQDETEIAELLGDVTT